MRTIRFAAAVTASAGALVLGAFVAPSAATGADELIAYAIGGGEDHWVIRTVKADGSDNRRLIGPRRRLFRLGPSSPEWSPDGKRLLFGGHHRADLEAQSLWYSRADGKQVRQIRLGLGSTGHGPRAVRLYGWDWAPDGRRVVFAARRGRAAYPRLYTISIDGRRRRALRRGSWPEWSSDGRNILFSLLPRSDPFGASGRGRIAVVRPSGNGFRRLTDSTRDTFPRFSPDGQRVVFVRDTPAFGSEWRLVDVNGRDDAGVRSDRPGTPGYCLPGWTPDGTRLASLRFESTGETDSYVARFVTLSLTGADERVAFTFSGRCSGWGPICDFSWQRR